MKKEDRGVEVVDTRSSRLHDEVSAACDLERSSAGSWRGVNKEQLVFAG
jgi:hypothetical protein